MTEWTDTSGNSLQHYPRPSVAVDVAVLTVIDADLRVVVVRNNRCGLSLPGTFLHPGERLSDAAKRALSLKVGIEDCSFHQLQMFDDPARDDRGWVLSMAHAAAIPARSIPPDSRVISVIDGLPTQALEFDHADMISASVDDLRSRYAASVDPDRLLPEQFTILELRQLYQVIYGRALPKDTFRRHVVGALATTDLMTAVSGGRPAELFTRRGDARLSANAAAFLASARG